MADFIGLLNNYIWSIWLIGLCLVAGLFYSISTRFVQVRLFKEMLRLLFRGKPTNDGISSFQALAVSLAGRVGMGNIAGVAAAIGFGGPSAVFWMWIVAFFGASTAYIESTLGQIYKERDPVTGEYRGGPAYYFEKGLGQKWYGIIFAIASIVACGIFLPGVQANGVVNAVAQVAGNGSDVALMGIQTSTNRLIAMGIVLVVLGFIIFGGIKRIARFTEYAVPFMALGYIILALLIMVTNYHKIPEVFGLIFSDILSPQAAFGAALGWGVKRGIYSNEAGQGTGPHAAAAAEVDHPAQQGLVQAFSVYVDTLLVCSATAFMILSTGMYNIQDNADAHPERYTFTAEGAPSWLKIDNKTGEVSLSDSFSYAQVASMTDQPISFVINSANEAAVDVEVTQVDDTSTPEQTLVPTLIFNALDDVPGKPATIHLNSDMGADDSIYTPTLYILNNIDADTEINSPSFTQMAMKSVYGTFGDTFIAVAVFFFAFTTILAYYYIAEVNVSYLTRFIGEGASKVGDYLVRFLIMVMVAYGGLNSAGYIWGLGDVGVGLMAWLNIIGIIVIFFVARPALNILKDYEEQLKAGGGTSSKRFVFDPAKFGIKGATYWEDRHNKSVAAQKPAQDKVR